MYIYRSRYLYTFVLLLLLLLLPPANKVCEGYVSTCVCLSAGGMVSQHSLQVSRGCVSQHALQVSRPTPKGEFEGSGHRGVSRPTPRGGSPGPLPGRVSRPTPGGGGIPACTEADPPDGYCSGRYASYWNAFLLLKKYKIPSN